MTVYYIIIANFDSCAPNPPPESPQPPIHSQSHQIHYHLINQRLIQLNTRRIRAQLNKFHNNSVRLAQIGFQSVKLQLIHKLLIKLYKIQICLDNKLFYNYFNFKRNLNQNLILLLARILLYRKNTKKSKVLTTIKLTILVNFFAIILNNQQMQRRRNRITTLVNARDKPIKTEKQLRAIVRVGQSVNLSVERFVAVGEAIADDNPEIRVDMYDACKDARAAGTLIEQLCDTSHEEATQLRSYADKSGMVRAARALLSSVTRVLLIADTVVVKQLISAKDRVSISLNRLENVANFTEFVKAFSQFGTEMVELAHLTGDRQNDLKDERRRAQMSAARQILERSTMMLLTSSKACLRHPDSDTARENRDTVFLQMRRAMDLIHMVVKDGVIPRLAASAASYETNSRKTVRHGHHGHVSRYAASAGYQSPEWKLEEWEECITAYNAIRRFQDLIEMSRMTLVGTSTRDRLSCALDAVVERTQDFTDSAYTSHEHREKILLLCDRAKLELNTLLRIGVCLEQAASSSPSEDFEASIVQTLRASNDLKQELQDTALDQTDELFKLHSSHDLVNRLRNAALAGDHERQDEYTDQFTEYAEHVQEVCRLLHHTSTTETLQISSKNTETSIQVYGSQLVSASQTLALHPNSKIAKENLEVFAEVWHSLVSDVAQLTRDVSELVRGCPLESSIYMSLPKTRANTSTMAAQPKTPPSASSQSLNTNTGITNTAQQSKTSKQLDSEEVVKSQAQVKASGQTAAEMDVEGEKWSQSANPDNEDNDIVRKAKSMSTMAISMYQFTRGEGELKTTQDLFTQAEFFADEANKLYKIVRHFTYQVPSGPPKKELLDNLDKVPTFVQQLQFAVKNVTVGKAATFTKVDNVIQETKNLMGVISKVVTSCMSCANKYNVDMQGVLRTRSRTLSPSCRGDTDMYYEGGGSMSKGVTSSSDPDI